METRSPRSWPRWLRILRVVLYRYGKEDRALLRNDPVMWARLHEKDEIW